MLLYLSIHSLLNAFQIFYSCGITKKSNKACIRAQVLGDLETWQGGIKGRKKQHILPKDLFSCISYNLKNQESINLN